MLPRNDGCHDSKEALSCVPPHYLADSTSTAATSCYGSSFPINLRAMHNASNNPRGHATGVSVGKGFNRDAVRSWRNGVCKHGNLHIICAANVCPLSYSFPPRLAPPSSPPQCHHVQPRSTRYTTATSLHVAQLRSRVTRVSVLRVDSGDRKPTCCIPCLVLAVPSLPW